MAPTAYMLFCNEHREAARQKLAAEGHEKIPVTLVAKELGQLWKALSDEEKAKYKAQAEEQQQQQQQQAGDGDEQQGQETGEGQQKPDVLNDLKANTIPGAWVRRLVGVDPDIQRCSADAVLALSLAADVFLAAMCSKATAAAAGAKRRTVRLDDVERCVRGDKRLVSVGMTAVMNMVAAAATGGEEGKGAAGPPGKKPKLDKPVAVNNSIQRAFGLA
ncbi:hypothetical protein Agub_g1274 [Astrephomene gubernaculifera]|uniref:HMG box domain-containing protein n=1 Tax=Astrephomene gubernaculifera TaxID=47775 RepID=A0AAD3HHC8_9CHLO|nr:hypothetical protein Agub_g1274 [Astrephomene gubernaculifera]